MLILNQNKKILLRILKERNFSKISKFLIDYHWEEKTEMEIYKEFTLKNKSQKSQTHF